MADQDPRGSMAARGFDKSPEFERAVGELMEMTEVKALQQGYALLDADLNVVSWAPDLADAIERLLVGETAVCVPDAAEDPHHVHAALIAGLAFTLESSRQMVRCAPEIDVTGWEAAIERVNHHLFGGSSAYTDSERAAAAVLAETNRQQAETMPHDSPLRALALRSASRWGRVGGEH